MSFAGLWVELKIIMLSEISQTQNAKIQKFSFILEARGRKEKGFLKVEERPMKQRKRMEREGGREGSGTSQGIKSTKLLCAHMKTAW